MSKQTEFYETLRQTQTNTFSDGLNMDLHPLTTPSTILTDCVNGTMITYNDNEFVLQNDRGNLKIPDAKLPVGYVPVGLKEHNGILYIVSHNPQTNETEIGSYPSPTQNNDILSTDHELIYPGRNIDWSKKYYYPNELNSSEIIYIQEMEKQMVSGIDQYILDLSNEVIHPIYHLQFFAKSKNGNTQEIKLIGDLETAINRSFPFSHAAYIGYLFRVPYITSSAISRNGKGEVGSNLKLQATITSNDAHLTSMINKDEKYFNLKLYTNYYFVSDDNDRIPLFSVLKAQAIDNTNIKDCINDFTPNELNPLNGSVCWDIDTKDNMGINTLYYIKPMEFDDYGWNDDNGNLMNNKNMAPKISFNKDFGGLHWDSSTRKLSIDGKEYTHFVVDYVPVIEFSIDDILSNTSDIKYLILDENKNTIVLNVSDVVSDPDWFTEFWYYTDDNKQLNIFAKLSLDYYFGHSNYISDDIRINMPSVELHEIDEYGNISPIKVPGEFSNVNFSKNNTSGNVVVAKSRPMIAKYSSTGITLQNTFGEIIGKSINNQCLELFDINKTYKFDLQAIVDKSIKTPVIVGIKDGTTERNEVCSAVVTDACIDFKATVNYQPNKIYLLSLSFYIDENNKQNLIYTPIKNPNLSIIKDQTLSISLNDNLLEFNKSISGEYEEQWHKIGFIVVTTPKMLDNYTAIKSNYENRMDKAPMSSWLDVSNIKIGITHQLDDLVIDYLKYGDNRLPHPNTVGDDWKKLAQKYINKYNSLTVYNDYTPGKAIPLNKNVPYYSATRNLQINGTITENKNNFQDLIVVPKFASANVDIKEVGNINLSADIFNNNIYFRSYEKATLAIDEINSLGIHDALQKCNTRKEYLLKYLNFGDIKDKYYKNINGTYGYSSTNLNKLYFNTDYQKEDGENLYYNGKKWNGNVGIYRIKFGFSNKSWDKLDTVYKLLDTSEDGFGLVSSENKFWNCTAFTNKRNKWQNIYSTLSSTDLPWVQDNTYLNTKILSHYIFEQIYPGWQLCPCYNANNKNHNVYGHCIPYVTKDNENIPTMDNPLTTAGNFSLIGHVHSRDNKEDLLKDLLAISVHSYINVPSEQIRYVQELYYSKNTIETQVINSIQNMKVTWGLKPKQSAILYKNVDLFNIQSLNNLIGSVDTNEFDYTKDVQNISIPESSLPNQYKEFIHYLVSNNDYFTLNDLFIPENELYIEFDKDSDTLKGFKYKDCIPIHVDIDNYTGPILDIRTNDINKTESTFLSLLLNNEQWRFHWPTHRIYYMIPLLHQNTKYNVDKKTNKNVSIHFVGKWTNASKQDIEDACIYLHPQFIRWYTQLTNKFL